MGQPQVVSGSLFLPRPVLGWVWEGWVKDSGWTEEGVHRCLEGALHCLGPQWGLRAP